MDWQKIKFGFWGAIGGAIFLAIIGFNWGGWVTSSTARAMAEEKAERAVTDRLTPICVRQFNGDSEKKQKLAELKATDSWRRDRYIEDQGWATMPGEEKPDSKIAEACAAQIIEANQAA